MMASTITVTGSATGVMALMQDALARVRNAVTDDLNYVCEMCITRHRDAARAKSGDQVIPKGKKAKVTKPNPKRKV